MLSKREIERIQSKLAKNPARNLRRILKKKLIEHEHASNHPLFSPPSHHQFFINRLTNEETLRQMIQMAKLSTIFFLDTESVSIYRQRNRPALLQLQMNPPDILPLVLIVEVHHLPSIHSNQFEQIRKLFRIVLDSKNKIYTWGNINELNEFCRFNLFNINQIKIPQNEDLQTIFKLYWQANHPHQLENKCRCENCIGKAPINLWSLQDAVCYQLNEWLDKRYTLSPFDMGLDPNLLQTNDGRNEERMVLTKYAANDVLAMEKLFSSMQEQTRQRELHDQQQDQTMAQHHRSKQLIKMEYDSNDSTEEKQELNSPFSEEIRSNISHQQQTMEHQFADDDNEYYRRFEQQQGIDRNIKRKEMEEQSRQEESTKSLHEQNRSNEDNEETQRMVSHDEQHNRLNIRSFNQPNHERKWNRQRQELNQYTNRTNNQKIIRNRICTIKQRIRNFRCEIIRREIDHRFSIRIVKEILRRYDVPYTAINISKSSINGKRSLYIGIKNKSMLKEYETRTRHLFTTDFYNEFTARHRVQRKERQIRTSRIANINNGK